MEFLLLVSASPIDSFSVPNNLQPRNSLEMLVPAHNRCTICQSISCIGLIHIDHRPSSGSKQSGYGPENLIGIFVQIEHEKLIK